MTFAQEITGLPAFDVFEDVTGKNPTLADRKKTR